MLWSKYVSLDKSDLMCSLNGRGVVDYFFEDQF